MIKQVSTQDQLLKIVKEKETVVFLSAQWSDVCKEIAQNLLQVSQQYPNFSFLEVEAEDMEDYCIANDVEAVPFFLIYKNGQLKTKIDGAYLNKVVVSLETLNQQNEQQQKKLKTIDLSLSNTKYKSIDDRILGLTKSQPITLFMKGSPDAPFCGFSKKVVSALENNGASSIGYFDILKDQDVRQGLKKFSEWPTYPQLYVEGEFLGGCDIILEMDTSGELKELIADLIQRNIIDIQQYSTPQIVHNNQNAISYNSSNSNSSSKNIDINNNNTQNNNGLSNDGTINKLGANVDQRIAQLTNKNQIMLFMKGSIEEPRCGFSSKVVQILKSNKLDFKTYDILLDTELREQLKQKSDWPTYPQLYAYGEFIGGCDIITQLQESGELVETILDNKQN